MHTSAKLMIERDRDHYCHMSLSSVRRTGVHQSKNLRRFLLCVIRFIVFDIRFITCMIYFIYSFHSGLTCLTWLYTSLFISCEILYSDDNLMYPCIFSLWNLSCSDLYLRNEIHFSDVYRSINCIGSRAKWMNPEGAHVNFASGPL